DHSPSDHETIVRIIGIGRAACPPRQVEADKDGASVGSGVVSSDDTPLVKSVGMFKSDGAVLLEIGVIRFISRGIAICATQTFRTGRTIDNGGRIVIADTDPGP